MCAYDFKNKLVNTFKRNLIAQITGIISKPKETK